MPFRLHHHECDDDDMVVLGERPNPLNADWLPWCAVACKRCGQIHEWQVHSDESAHGGALETTARPSSEYVTLLYRLSASDIQEIINGSRKAVRYDRYTKQYSQGSARVEPNA
jgi:hypothetical protein